MPRGRFGLFEVSDQADPDSVLVEEIVGSKHAVKTPRVGAAMRAGLLPLPARAHVDLAIGVADAVADHKVIPQAIFPAALQVVGIHPFGCGVGLLRVVNDDHLPHPRAHAAARDQAGRIKLCRRRRLRRRRHARRFTRRWRGGAGNRLGGRRWRLASRHHRRRQRPRRLRLRRLAACDNNQRENPRARRNPLHRGQPPVSRAWCPLAGANIAQPPAPSSGSREQAHSFMSPAMLRSTANAYSRRRRAGPQMVARPPPKRVALTLLVGNLGARYYFTQTSPATPIRMRAT